MKTSLLQAQRCLIKHMKAFKSLLSQLRVLGETLSQEDVNQKLLRSLSPEWNTHAVVWRNKPELETISMDDLYIISNTNEAVNTAHRVSAASTQVSAANFTTISNKQYSVVFVIISLNNLQKYEP
ncbi:hypothetical protein Tco_1010565 [Tanacetum coccineum]